MQTKWAEIQFIAERHKKNCENREEYIWQGWNVYKLDYPLIEMEAEGARFLFDCYGFGYWWDYSF